MSISKSEVNNLAKEYHQEIISVRRHIHENPELSFHEFQTSAFIKDKLKSYGIPFKHGYVKTGIIGKIEGTDPSKKVIALRADIDALPIQEENDVPYKSKNKQVMHACGHDVHTASLLGTAKILNTLRNKFEGTVLLIFQPAEEKLPGGAKLMMEEGALSDPVPELIIGQHVMPNMKAGKVGFRSGMYMASADEIYLTIKGKGGHAAMPHQITDSVLITSHIIVALQQIASRFAPAKIPTVLSFGKIIANGATNVIPSQVDVEGTFRTMNEKWREEAHQLINDICKSTAKSMRGECEVEIKKGYPFLVNNEKITEKAINSAKSFLGDNNVEQLDLRMTAEDFAYYSQQYPTTFYRLGIMDEAEKLRFPLHSSKFNVDEKCLETGMATMSWLALSMLMPCQ